MHSSRPRLSCMLSFSQFQLLLGSWLVVFYPGQPAAKPVVINQVQTQQIKLMIV